jgi:PmbA protein
LIDAARGAVEAALVAGAGDAEAYASEGREREVRVHGGEIESLTAATQRGLGLRAWIGGRVGYAYGTDLGEAGVAALAARAVEAARAADEDEFAGPPAAGGEPPPRLELGDDSIESWSMAEVADLALAVEREALAADPRVAGVEQAVYAGSADRVAIASSTGIEGEYESSSCYAYAMVLARGEEGTETGLGFDLARGPGALDPAAVGREGAERATAMIGAGKPDSRGCPVVLDQTVAASFVGLLGGVLGADAVQRGRSPFAERIGTAVGSAALTLHDDGLDPAGPATAPFDGEGVSSTRTAVIEAGTLRTYLFDTYAARRGGVETTANAGRAGYRSLPGVSASNLVVAPGSLGFDELLGAAGDGVLVTDVAGLHSGVNSVTGVFSVGASGRAIRGGEPAEPLREFTIASDLVSMLGAVREAGAEARWVPFGGSVSTPALLIGEMTVAGA